MTSEQATRWIRMCSEALANPDITPEVMEYRLESRLLAFSTLGEDNGASYFRQTLQDLYAEASKELITLPNINPEKLTLATMLDLVWHYGVNPAFLLGTSRQAFLFTTGGN